jgi:hypothetical protein
MEAKPPAPLEVPEPDLLLEFLVIALDAPAQLGQADELSEGDALRYASGEGRLARSAGGVKA